MSDTTVARIATALLTAFDANPSLRQGALCFYGSWEGGRRGENVYTVTNVMAEDGVLVLFLTDGREVRLADPEGVHVWKTGITVRSVSRFLIQLRAGSDAHELTPPKGWPPNSVSYDFEFAW